jgi:hypothetical protein
VTRNRSDRVRIAISARREPEGKLRIERGADAAEIVDGRIARLGCCSIRPPIDIY